MFLQSRFLIDSVFSFFSCWVLAKLAQMRTKERTISTFFLFSYSIFLRVWSPQNIDSPHRRPSIQKSGGSSGAANLWVIAICSVDSSKGRRPGSEERHWFQVCNVSNEVRQYYINITVRVWWSIRCLFLCCVLCSDPFFKLYFRRSRHMLLTRLLLRRESLRKCIRFARNRT